MNGSSRADLETDCTARKLSGRLSLPMSALTRIRLILLACTLAWSASAQNLQPVVAITNPTNETNVLIGDIALTADAFDPDGTIARVEFFDGTNKLTELTNAPYSFLWTNPPLGIHPLTARAWDNLGTNKTSAVVTVFVVTTGGSVTMGFEKPAGPVNLTTEGVADWVHWGLLFDTSINRKAGVPPMISNFTYVGAGPAYQFYDNYNGYTWTDGTPQAGVTNTTTGVAVFGVGNGFELQVPATNAFRTLRVHLGVYAGRGKIQAWVTDYTAAVVIDSSVDNAGNGPGGIYTITYKASSPGQKLIVRYTLSSRYASDGNVTLQAATMLSDNNPPSVTLLSPAPDTVVKFGSNVTLAASASDSDGTISHVEFYRNAVLVGTVSNAPYSFTLTNIAAGNYSITARAVDNGGAFASSSPAALYVITGTGMLRGSFTNPPAAVNLTTAGRIDWAHWALVNKGSLNRRSGGTPWIPDVTTIGAGQPARYADNYTAFSWTNGTPTTVVSGTSSGLYMNGLSNGFRITVPADPRPKRLSVYAGVYGARSRFEATLSDSSAAPYFNRQLEGIYANGYGIYTVDFAAGSSNQTLSVRYTAESLSDTTYGNVTWQAATLAPVPPTLSLQRAANGGAVSGRFFAWNGLVYTVEAADTLHANTWQAHTNIVGGGTNSVFFDTTSGARFYRVKID